MSAPDPWCVIYDDVFDDFYHPCSIGIGKMAKDYMISSGHAYDTEADALDAAKKRTAKYLDDVKVYKAIKLVSTTTPNVEVKDI